MGYDVGWVGGGVVDWTPADLLGEILKKTDRVGVQPNEDMIPIRWSKKGGDLFELRNLPF